MGIRLVWMVVLFFLTLAQNALAYYRPPPSEIDAEIFRIDEEKYMGVRFGKGAVLLDHEGKEVRFDDLPAKPIVLLLSYYQCDGSCSALNTVVKEMVPQLKLALGKGYQILTVSFDQDDTVATTTAFRNHLELPAEWLEHWTFTTFQKIEQIEEETKKIGYKFFWSPQDRIFFHPMVMVILTAEGRVSRYLNALNATPLDVEMALLEAREGKFKVNEVLDYAVSLCYSYNFKEGRYVLNLPVFIGLGSMLVGILALVWSIHYYRRNHDKSMEERV